MRILLLGGTLEARALAQRLDRDGRLDLVVSLAGATRAAARGGALDGIAGEIRVGGFGGEAGQERYLREARIDTVIDATHPFAARISARTRTICARMGIAYVQLLRPAWQPEAGDDWRDVARAEDVRAHVAAGATVFLATGPGSVAAIGPLPAARVICRRIDPPEAGYPHPNGAWLVARPPFEVADEVALFAREGVDLVVAKNAGGAGGRAKLLAARQLGLPVVMIARPPDAGGHVVDSVEGVLDWLEAL